MAPAGRSTLAGTLILAIGMAFRIMMSRDQFTPDTVPNIIANIVILGVLVLPMIVMVASGAGTGFVLSGAVALVAIVLFRIGNQILDISTGEERVILGMLIAVMLPIVQSYHAAVDRRYPRQKEAQVPLRGDGS